MDRKDVSELFSERTVDYFLEKTDMFVKGLDKYILENKKVEDLESAWISLIKRALEKEQKSTLIDKKNPYCLE